jgi:hypothetical protein
LTPAAPIGILAGMDAEHRARAESRLQHAAADLGLADPRSDMRERLRHLRQAQPDAFRRAIEHYEATVLPALAEGEPLEAWLDYGRFVGQLTANGRLTAVDTSGRAAAYRPPPVAGTLIMFVPEDTAVDALLVVRPQQPAPAQQASIDLLVHRRLAL